MAEKFEDLKGTADLNAKRIAAARGTSNALADEVPQPGLVAATRAVQDDLVENAGYQKVRHTGTEEIVFNHSYWFPGDVRVLGPGELDRLNKDFAKRDGVSFEEVAHTNLGDIVDDHAAHAAELTGNYFIGDKQAAARALGIAPEPTKAEAKAAAKGADDKDAAISRQAERDSAKKPEDGNRTVIVTDPTGADANAAPPAASRPTAQERSDADKVANVKRS